MSNITKFLSALVILFGISISTYGQWCVPVVTESFNHGMQRFTINGNPAIDRISGANELYVFTGLSTTLQRGATYNVTFNQNYGFFCSLTNMRIWIDYNKDTDFEDTDELVISITNSGSTQLQSSFTVPQNAVLDSTRMRVASKMTASCGHTMPNPCNNPPDPIGWHGEFEDYTVLIVNPTGIIPVNGEIPDKFVLSQNYPNPFNPATTISFKVAKSQNVQLVIYDALGKEITTLIDQKLEPGTFEAKWDAGGYPSGLYFYKLISPDFVEVKKMMLIK